MPWVKNNQNLHIKSVKRYTRMSNFCTTHTVQCTYISLRLLQPGQVFMRRLRLFLGQCGHMIWLHMTIIRAGQME